MASAAAINQWSRAPSTATTQTMISATVQKSAHSAAGRRLGKPPHAATAHGRVIHQVTVKTALSQWAAVVGRPESQRLNPLTAGTVTLGQYRGNPDQG